MFGMLLWKEWRENLWKLWFCGAASVVFTFMLFRIRIVPDVSNCMLISLVQMFVVPVVYSLDIFSGEVSNRTIHLLFKIPVERWMIFFSKYLVSVLGMVLIFAILNDGVIIKACRTEQLRESVRKFALTPAPGADFSQVPGILDALKVGDSVSIAIDGCDPAKKALLKEMSANGMTETALNLDEIFEAYVIGNRGRELSAH